MPLFPQPTDLLIDEPVEETGAACDRCDDGRLLRYRIVDYRGWKAVTKCRACLWTASSEAITPPPFQEPGT